jgi:WD40 repeat protein
MLAFSPDSKTVATAGAGIREGQISIRGNPAFRGAKIVNHVKLWNVSSGELIWTSPDGDLGQLHSLVFSPDGQALYCCDQSATTRIDARTGQVRQDLLRASEHKAR